MRLKRLALTCYGHFEAQTLTLDTRPGCINLVLAPNGAGKSVLRQAVTELLFGIHMQTPMGFLFGYPRMRLHAEAEEAGTPFAFTRRKGGDTNTVLDAAGRPADAALLGRLPRREDRERLKRLFMLDSATLRAGGRALLQSDGDLADALLSGTGELAPARAIATRLAEQRDSAAPERKNAKRPFYAACDQWAEAGLTLAKAVTHPPAIAAREAARDAARASQAAANAEAAHHAGTLARLARIRAARRPLQALAEAEAWLAAHPHAPALPPAVGEALAGAEAALADAAKDHAALAGQHRAALHDLAAQPVDEAVRREAVAIAALTLDSGRAEQSRGDMPKRREELADSRRKQDALRQQVGPGANPACTDAEIAAARALIQAVNGINADLASAASAVAALRQKIDSATQDQADLPPAAQTSQLKALLAEATADGDPARQAEAAHAACRDAAIALAAALARVPRWAGGAEALLALPAPSDAALIRLDGAARDAAAQWATARKEHNAALARLDGLRGRLDALTGAGPLPDAAAVAVARAHRDHGWQLVEARLAGRPGDENTWDASAPLPLAYARAVTAADALADRRAAETERLASAASLADDIKTASPALDACVAGLNAARDVDTRAQAEWRTQMAALGLPEGAGAAEARAFLTERHAVIAAAAARNGAAGQQAHLLARQAAWAAGLAEASGQAADRLPVAIALARDQVEHAEQAEYRRQALAKDIRAAQRQMVAEDAALTAVQAAQAAWAGEWQAILARLGRPAEETPAATGAALDALLNLRAELAATATIEARLHEMAAQLEGFAQQAHAIGARLGMAGEDDPAVLAQTLANRLRDADAQHATHQALQRQADTLAAGSEAAARALAAAQTALAQAVAATGATDLDTARQRVDLAARRLAQEAIRAEARHRLDEDGEGRTPDALRAEAAAMTPEEVADLQRQAEADAPAAQARAQAAAATAAEIEKELAMLSDGHAAATAALDRQAAAARISRVLEDALVQHAAAAMLEHALKQVEAEAGANAKLARIGTVFAGLTGGAYTHVSPGEEDVPSRDHGRLQTHEASGGGIKHVAQLSEGTRDQLYLALRIVAVEDHAAGPSLPFIADDVLQTFDDARALAALRALLDLSRHTQVIVLTHHPHVAALAASLPEGSVHRATL